MLWILWPVRVLRKDLKSMQYCGCLSRGRLGPEPGQSAQMITNVFLNQGYYSLLKP